MNTNDMVDSVLDTVTKPARENVLLFYSKSATNLLHQRIKPVSGVQSTRLYQIVTVTHTVLGDTDWKTPENVQRLQPAWISTLRLSS